MPALATAGGTDVGFERCGGIGGGELVEPLRVGIGGGIVGDFEGAGIAGMPPVTRPDAFGTCAIGWLVGEAIRPDAFGCAIGTAPLRFVAAGWLVGDAMRPDAFGGCAIGTAPLRFGALGWLVGEAVRPDAFGGCAIGTAPVRLDPGGGATDFGGGIARPCGRGDDAPEGPAPILDGIASSI